MTKYGRPVAGRAGVEHLGDVRVVHQGQRLPLGLEAGEDLLRVHPGLDELERDQSFDRLGLLGHPDRAHAALADLFEQLVLPGNDAAGDVGWIVDRARAGEVGGGSGWLEESTEFRFRGEKRLDAGAKFRIDAADAVQVRDAFGHRPAVAGGQKDRFNAGELGHDGTPRGMSPPQCDG